MRGKSVLLIIGGGIAAYKSLDLIRRLAADGGDPLADAEAWLKSHDADVSALARTIQAARQSGAPTLPMLAHLATIARHALSE